MDYFSLIIFNESGKLKQILGVFKMKHAMQCFDTDQEQWITFEHITGVTDQIAKNRFSTILKTRAPIDVFKEWRLVKIEDLERVTIP